MWPFKKEEKDDEYTEKDLRLQREELARREKIMDEAIKLWQKDKTKPKPGYDVFNDVDYSFIEYKDDWKDWKVQYESPFNRLSRLEQANQLQEAINKYKEFADSDKEFDEDH